MLDAITALPMGFYAMLLFAVFVGGTAPLIAWLYLHYRRRQRIPQMRPFARNVLVMMGIGFGAIALAIAAGAFAVFGVLRQWQMAFLVVMVAGCAIGFCVNFALAFYAALWALLRPHSRPVVGSV